jgi:drug/metabolite transporter (DMT)-like permease
MHALNRSQLTLLALITVLWGLNWPIVKLGVTQFPPLSFRSVSMWLGLPVLAAVLWWMKVPFRLARQHWAETFRLGMFNLVIWNVCLVLAIRSLPSGRAAILGYTMPIFSALIGALWYAAPLARRGWVGVSAAAVGVALLLWHEITGLAGHPLGVALMLMAAATWALGTQMLRRTTIEAHTLTLAFWMSVQTMVVCTVLAVVFERHQWGTAGPGAAGSIAYNAVLIFGLTQAVWFTLARSLPPTASTLSTMLIPIVGVFSGAWWLGEVLRWQDWAAMGLMVVALGSVLWPARSAVG